VSEQADMEQAASELVRWRAVRPDGTVLLDALTPSVAGWPGWRIDPETHVIGAQLGEGARPPWRVECRTEPDGIWYTWVVAEDGQLTWMTGRTDPDVGVHVLFHEVAVGRPVDGKVYVVITEDRHTDVEVDLFTTADAAIEFAKQRAADWRQFPPEEYEGDDEVGVQEIEGRLYHETYSGEGDCVWVIEKDIHGPEVDR